MAKLTAFYLIFFIKCLQACNPNSDPNAASVEAPNGTTRPRPIPIVPASIPQAEISASTITDTAPAPVVPDAGLQEEYVANCHNDENKRSASQAHQHIIVSGLPFQRGESHGRQAKEKILKSISFYKNSASMPTWNECINFVRTHYLEAMNHHYPNGLEEMKGIAEGAGVQLEDILILNSKYELMRWKKHELLKSHADYPSKKARHSSESPECIRRQISLDLDPATEKGFTTTAISEDEETESNTIGDAGADECTGAVALSSSTKYAHVLLGQNWDTNEFVLTNDTAILLEVYPDPCEHIKPFVMLTEAGQLGNIGMNSDGLGVVTMSLKSSSDTFKISTGRGWIPSSLLRRMFLESPNFSIGLKTILHTPIHVSVNMIIATAEDEALNIELTPNSHFTSHVPLEKEFFAHSNHFKSASFIAQNEIKEGSRGGTSLFRDRRVERHLMNDWPRITEETFQTAFKDSVGYPRGVCEVSLPTDSSSAWTSTHKQKMTVASLILNLSERTLQVTKGPPCTRAYINYCFKFSQL